MICSIETENTAIPYTQLTFGPNQDDEDFIITFRRYQRRVFVGIEDYRFVDSSKEPVPSFIIEKTAFERFDPHKAFFRALHFLGQVGDEPSPEMEAWVQDIWEGEYVSMEPVVTQWMNTPVPTVVRGF